jgi:hypothetical protein
MDIDCAIRRDLECARWQNQSVCCNNQNVRPSGSEAIDRARVLESLRLKDIQAARDRQLLDGTRGWMQAAPRRPVRLCQSQYDVVAGVEQRRQRARCKLWSTGKY